MAQLLAGLALFIVVAIPVGVIDILSNDCDGGFLALGGCQGPGADKGKSFLDDAGYDVASAIFAGIVAVAVAAVLVAFGLPGYFFGGDNEEPPSDRFSRIEWLGFGLWCLAVLGGVGALMASWIQSDEFTGNVAAANIDSTPENINGIPSHEFEPADIRRAQQASPEVRAYCSGAVSEAQYVGCLSHVDESDIP